MSRPVLTTDNAPLLSGRGAVAGYRSSYRNGVPESFHRSSTCDSGGRLFGSGTAAATGGAACARATGTAGSGVSGTGAATTGSTGTTGATGRNGPGKAGADGKTGGGPPGSFGQGCLMARRLVEAGVPFVEVVMGDGAGWDTHRDNFPRTRSLSRECDTAMAALVEDLNRRGLLDTTLVVWMGEFGRTPQCTGGGRNHWSRAWSSVLIGGGIKGGQVVGRTDRDAAAVVERPIGEGGMAIVYAAQHLELRQRVAVKVMRRTIAADAGARSRFAREARAAAALQSEAVKRFIQTQYKGAVVPAF